MNFELDWPGIDEQPLMMMMMMIPTFLFFFFLVIFVFISSPVFCFL